MEYSRPTPEALREQLDRIKRHALFESAPVVTGLLEYLAERWLGDELENITEYTIAVDHFRKPAIWNPKTGTGTKTGKPDGTVRVTMRNLKRRLEKFYSGWAILHERVHISFAKNSYVPIIVQSRPSFREMSPLPDQLQQKVLRAASLVDTRGMYEERRAHDYFQSGLALFDPNDESKVRFYLDMLLAYVNAQNTLVTLIPDRFERAEEVLAVFRAKGWYVDFLPWECLYVEGCILAVQRELRKAKVCFRKAEELSDGASLQFWWTIAWYASASDDYLKQGIAHLTGYINKFARTNTTCRADLATLLVLANRYEDAAAIIEETEEFSKLTGPLAVAKLLLFEATNDFDKAATCRVPMPHYSFHFAGLDAVILGRSGDLAGADAILSSIAGVTGMTAFAQALGHIGIGDYDRAVELLRKAAFEEHDPYLMWFHIYPPLRHLRAHSGYHELLEALQLQMRD